MSQIIIICDTAEWFRLVLLLCMHFCITLYLLLMGTKICIRKHTFSQIVQILVTFSSGSNCSFCDFYFVSIITVLSFLLIFLKISILIFIIFLFTFVWLLPQSFDPIMTLHLSPSILIFPHVSCVLVLHNFFLRYHLFYLSYSVF